MLSVIITPKYSTYLEGRRSFSLPSILSHWRVGSINFNVSCWCYLSYRDLKPCLFQLLCSSNCLVFLPDFLLQNYCPSVSVSWVSPCQLLHTFQTDSRIRLPRKDSMITAVRWGVPVPATYPDHFNNSYNSRYSFLLFPLDDGPSAEQKFPTNAQWVREWVDGILEPTWWWLSS